MAADVALESARMHALIDGLLIHGLLCPDPDSLRQILGHHLDTVHRASPTARKCLMAKRSSGSRTAMAFRGTSCVTGAPPD